MHTGVTNRWGCPTASTPGAQYLLRVTPVSLKQNKTKNSSSILGRAGVVCYLGADPPLVTCTGWGPGNTWGPGFGLWSLFLPTAPASRVHGGAIPPPTGAEGNIENKEGVQKVIDTKK